MKKLFSLLVPVCFLASLALADPSVSITPSGIAITATDGSDSCRFVAPVVTDRVIIQCFSGPETNDDEEILETVLVQLGRPIGSSFHFGGHVIEWLFTRLPNTQIGYDIYLDGAHYSGTF